MRRKEEYVYVGVDLHKVTHTAVLLDCWNEKLDEITFNNIPSEFIKLEKMVKKYCKKLSKEKGIAIEPVYGLEDAYGYGRSLALYLLERKFIVKDVNPSLSNLYRRSAPTTKKNDCYDAQGVATILINMLDTLPNAKPLDDYWTLAQLVNRRDNIVTDNTRVKNQLNEQLFHAYPSYRKFFTVLDRPTALYFWGTYPSPQHLQGVTVEQLAGELRPISHNQCSTKRAQLILDLVEKDGETIREFQNGRDFITRNLVRSLEYQNGELTAIEGEIGKMMVHFDCKLTSISGVSTVMAAKLLAEIGDINRFTSADRLASYAGIAPIRFHQRVRDMTRYQNRETVLCMVSFIFLQFRW